MALAQFLLPGEEVRYESAGAVRHGLTPYTLYLTGERLLLYSGGGRLGRGESVVAESLADLDSLGYEEGGLLAGRGSLKVNFRHETLALSGDPVVMKEVWQHLQPHAIRTAFAPPDEDATLVVPPEPLFDDQSHPPAQVEPIPLAPVRRPTASLRRLPFLLAAVFLLALAAAGAIRFRHRLFSRATSPPPTPTATPTAAPTPAGLRIMDEVFTLDPGAHRAFKFTIPPDGPAARLSGGFRVTAGSYIDFYVMSEAQYDRFAAGGPPDVTSSVFRKDQWNVRLGERLPAGNYYLVFDNRDGEGGAQTVAGEFMLVSE